MPVKFRTFVILALVLLAATIVGGAWWRAETAPLGNDFLRPGTPAEIRAALFAEPKPRLGVVNFWASWCEPCKREFPFFLRLRREYAERGVRVVFVSVDDADDFGAAEQFLRLNGIDFPTYYKGRQSLNFVAEIFPKWSGAVPATAIFAGTDAAPVESWEGDATWDELRTKVERHLGEP